MLKAIIFDMDGVLLKSTGLAASSFNMVLKKYDVKLDLKNWKKYLGRSLRDQLNMWKKENPRIPKDLDEIQFGKEAFKYQLEILKDKLIPDDVILNLIQKAKDEKIKVAVATSSTRHRAETILSLLGVLDKLDTLVTAEDVENHKPNPDIFLEAAKRVGVLSQNCVVIEDAVNGIQAANNAGMKSVALISENHSKEDFYEANHIFSNFNDLTLKDLKDLF